MTGRAFPVGGEFEQREIYRLVVHEPLQFAADDIQNVQIVATLESEQGFRRRHFDFPGLIGEGNLLLRS